MTRECWPCSNPQQENVRRLPGERGVGLLQPRTRPQEREGVEVRQEGREKNVCSAVVSKRETLIFWRLFAQNFFALALMWR